eukprot:gb/GECG01004665.1/.p1 GENE.gb/GECG01004665.1/~~gb/GECG01004665.1/.p1  ORF type:complete len:171 (+),score=18.30 gb/GECG01004665.1/:1-513(+)
MVGVRVAGLVVGATTSRCCWLPCTTMKRPPPLLIVVLAVIMLHGPLFTGTGTGIGSALEIDAEGPNGYQRTDKSGGLRQQEKAKRRALDARFCCDQNGDNLVSCSDCDFSGDSEIDLSFSGIAHIGNDVFQGAAGLSGVTEIDFQSNELQTLPEDLFSRLGNLQEMYDLA